MMNDSLALFRLILVGITAYLLGSISPSYLLGKMLKGIDIREHGSHNAGTANAISTIGFLPGLITMVLDIGKGALSAWIGIQLAGKTGMQIGTIAVVTGHNFPVWMHFRGGKGIAAFIGASLISFPATVAAYLFFSWIGIILSHYIAIGTLVAFTLLPFAGLWLTHGDISWFLTLLAVSFLILLKHRPNFVAIRNHTEKKFYFKTRFETLLKKS